MNQVEKVQHIYAAFGRGDVPAILEQLAPDVDWEYGTVDSGLPWMQRRRGRENVVGFFQALGEHLDFHKFEPTAFLQGDNLVVALIDAEFTVKGNGRRHVEVDEPHIWRFDAQGRIAKFRHAPDTYAQYVVYRG
jgi:ketosteroid isomerase-like protein